MTEEAPTEGANDGGAKPAGASKLKVVGIAVLTGLLAGGAGYGAGWVQGWLATSEAEEARDAAQSRVGELEARRRISLALEAIDEGNDGTARQELDEAIDALEASPNAQDSEIATLVGHLGAIEPSGETRSRIRQLASRLDELQSNAAAD